MARRRVKPIAVTPLVGGSLCLDFVNTTGARDSASPRERLRAPADLLVFLRRVGLLSRAEFAAATRRAGRHPVDAAAALVRAIEVREILYRILRSAACRTAPLRADLERFSREHSRGLAERVLEWKADGPRWSWVREPAGLEPRLGPILHSAAILLESGDLRALRKCGECDWLFLDATRNHSRRWCKKECGDRVKSRRYYERHRGAAASR